MNSLHKILKLNPATIYPGHGPVVQVEQGIEIVHDRGAGGQHQDADGDGGPALGEMAGRADEADIALVDGAAGDQAQQDGCKQEVRHDEGSGIAWCGGLQAALLARAGWVSAGLHIAFAIGPWLPSDGLHPSYVLFTAHCDGAMPSGIGTLHCSLWGSVFSLLY